MKTILFYISNISLGGGTERASITIANALAEKTENKIVIVTAYGERGKSIFSISEKIKVVYLNISGRPFANLFSINKGIAKAIKDFKIDTVVSNEVMSVYFTLPATKFSKRKPRFIVWEHFNFNATLGKKGREIARKISAKYADTIITLTEKDKTLWECELTPRAKIISIPNPSPFTINENPYNPDSKRVIAIGHLIQVKGFELLVQIWSIIREKYPQVKGWKQLIIGEGSEKENLEKRIKELGLQEIVELVPATRNIENYYKNSAFIVMTSRTEGLPMTLIEAQQFGLPAVSFYSDKVMYGVGEIITNETGYLIDQFDLDGFADKIFELMNRENLRNKLSENSFENSLKFSKNLILDNWIKIL